MTFLLCVAVTLVVICVFALLSSVGGFLIGATDYITGFTELELSHMVDVRNIFVWVFILTPIILVASIVFLVKQKDWKGMLWGSAIFIDLVLIIGLAFLINFDWAFELFHDVFFPQGNWQFSVDSAIITTFPLSYFVTVVIVTTAISISFATMLLILSIRRVIKKA